MASSSFASEQDIPHILYTEHMASSTELIEKTAAYIKAKFDGEGSGHDWWHIYRVWQLAKHIAKIEGGDMKLIELGALLHDIADFKFHGGDETMGGKVARAWLESMNADEKDISAIVHIVDNVSFKGLGEKSKMESLEGKIVQDADRLDALGAIGIARAFAYGGSKNRPIFDPGGKPHENKTFEEYKIGADSTLHHFYEKLLLLKDLMNTQTGKRMAEERHKYMYDFVKRFLAEWEAKE